MRRIGLVLIIGIFLPGVNQTYAQYPDIPKDVQAASEKLMKDAVQHSDAAWNKAYPIIQEEAKHGRPYIPWAARPYDLPQAEIPSFPGAMGGGAFSFGGRGGNGGNFIFAHVR